MRDVVIVGAKRTPIGDFLGSLKDVGAVDLGVTAVNAALAQAGVKPEMVTELACGMIYKAGAKGNPGRQIQLKVGMPAEGFACTIDQQCGSGMKAFEIASQSILLGKTDIAVAVGIESMSQAPYLMKAGREGYRMGHGEIFDSMLYDGLICAIMGYHMGLTAETLAERYGISRQEQDELAFTSHQRATKAIAAGVFKDEIVPVTIQTRKGAVIVEQGRAPARRCQSRASGGDEAGVQEGRHGDRRQRLRRQRRRRGAGADDQ